MSTLAVLLGAKLRRLYVHYSDVSKIQIPIVRDLDTQSGLKHPVIRISSLLHSRYPFLFKPDIIRPKKKKTDTLFHFIKMLPMTLVTKSTNMKKVRVI